MEKFDNTVEKFKEDYLEIGRFDSHPEVLNEVRQKIEEFQKDGWRLPKPVELKDLMDNNALSKDKFYWAENSNNNWAGYSYGMQNDFAYADPSREEGKKGPGVWLVLIK